MDFIVGGVVGGGFHSGICCGVCRGLCADWWISSYQLEAVDELMNSGGSLAPWFRLVGCLVNV